jgi:hypothetical protein
MASGVAFKCAGTRAAAHSKGEEEAGGGATGCLAPLAAERSFEEGGQAGPVLMTALMSQHNGSCLFLLAPLGHVLVLPIA